MSAVRDDVQDATSRRTFLAGVGWLRAFGTASSPTPTNGASGFAPGCQWQNPYGTSGSVFYINQGTATSATWLNIA